MTLSFTELTVAAFTSIPGQGVVYSVVVRDPLLNSSASYLPAHTYACSFASTLDNCRTLGETLSSAVLRRPPRSCDSSAAFAHNKLIRISHETAAPGAGPRSTLASPEPALRGHEGHEGHGGRVLSSFREGVHQGAVHPRRAGRPLRLLLWSPVLQMWSVSGGGASEGVT